MQGFHPTRTKPQDLAEIKVSQGGFLTGLNEDSPKSDVGDTQVTLLENAIPYRNMVEPRGGLKPSTAYLFNVADNATTLSPGSESLFHDEDWDEIFSTDSTTSAVIVSGTKDITTVFGGSSDVAMVDPTFKRVNDKLIVSDNNNIAIIEDRGSDYFIRPLISDAQPFLTTVFNWIVENNGSSGDFGYFYKRTFVRIVDGVVVSESGPPFVGDTTFFNLTDEFDGVTTDIAVKPSIAVGKPNEYFDTFGATDNYFTHIRIYRSTVQEGPLTLDDLNKNVNYYAVGDISLDSDTASSGFTLDFNVTDTELVSDNNIHPPLWSSGYQPLPANRIIEVSSAMVFVKADLTDLVYGQATSGDNEKYLGWYNPFYQFSNGINGEVTHVQDLGSAILVTAKNKSYYIDTINFSEPPELNDPNNPNVVSGIFTPILGNAVLVSKNIGINQNQRLALVKSKEGKLIGLTSDGAIREFSGYQWSTTDLARSKVHATTKGIIRNNNLSCDAAFSDDAYYLNYYMTEDSNTVQKTLRMGITEEAGFGFSKFTGEPLVAGDIDNQLGWPYYSTANTDGRKTSMLVIRGILFVLRRQTEVSSNPDSTFNVLHEYTGDKFDKKINKDAIDKYSESANLPVYSSTEYYDISSIIEFPETTAASETDFIYFQKANFFLRTDRYAFKVTNEVTTRGYQITDSNIENATLSDSSFDLKGYTGETESSVAETLGFSPTSAVVFPREVQDHRIRLRFSALGSGYQLSGMEARFKRHIRTEFDDTTTGNQILDLNTGMFTWINEKLNNLCVGTGRSASFDVGAPINGSFMGASPLPDIEGTAATITTGPDGSQTGVNLDANTYYEFQAPTVSSSTNATIMFWSDLASGKIVQTGYTSEHDNTYFFYANSTNGLIIQEVNAAIVTTYDTGTTMNAGYNHYAFVHNGANWLLYVNGILSFTSVANTLLSWVTSPSIRVGGTAALTVADIRMYNKVITPEELIFYINNVLNNEGDYVNGY